jgi:hypothetical protein
MVKKEEEGECQKQPVTTANEKIPRCFGITHALASVCFVWPLDFNCEIRENSSVPPVLDRRQNVRHDLCLWLMRC